MKMKKDLKQIKQYFKQPKKKKKSCRTYMANCFCDNSTQESFQ